jgi:hypothetical protein
MARMWNDGFDRQDVDQQFRGRRGRRGPGPRGEGRGGDGRGFRHGHHGHGHFGGYAYDDRQGGREFSRADREGGRGFGGAEREGFRGFGWAGRPEVSDELTQASHRLLGALRALSRSQEAGQRKAVAIMDDTTRTIYRLLSEEPETPTPPAAPAGGDTAA